MAVNVVDQRGLRAAAATLLVSLAVGCAKGRPPAPESAPHAAPARDVGSPEATAAPAGSPIDPAWAACVAEDECVVVALGCCHEQAVHRAHQSAARTALQDSGLEYCAPKAPCGPSEAGTWDGEPAVCDAGRCVLPDPIRDDQRER